MASTVSDMSPFLKWTLALIVCGGVAGTIQGFTSITRVASSATTMGLGNPVLSTLEAGGSIALSILLIALPIIAGLAVFVVLYFALKKVFRKIFKHTDLKTLHDNADYINPRL